MAEVQRDTQGSREDTLRFIDMIGLFGSQAMMALGKTVNPTTGKPERNLPIARLFIDTLEMLERKTHGNLNPDEARILRATLTDLRLMYADELKAGEQAPDKGEPAAAGSPTTASDAAASGSETGGSRAPATEAAPPAPDPSKVKYHKKYE